MKRGLLSLLILSALLLAVVACGGRDDQPAAPVAEAPAAATEAVVQQPEAAPAAATNTPVPPSATPVPPAATPEPDDEPISATQLAALEMLDSYRMTMTYATKGIDAEGSAVDNIAEIFTEYTRDPQARRTTITFTDNTAENEDATGTVETYQIGQDMYMLIDEEMGWMRVSMEDTPLEEGLLGVFTEGDFFTNLDQMQRVRPDQRINGIDSRHYRFNERALAAVLGAEVDDVTATGDVWIAKDGDYVTKYVLAITYTGRQGEGLSIELVSGTLEIAFELQDVNARFNIELPAAAATGVTMAGFEGEPFPVPPGARVLAASANFTMIESDTPAAEVAKFYDEALPPLGWIKDDQGSLSFGSMSSLAFTKGPFQLSLLISVDEDTGKTQILANAQ